MGRKNFNAFLKNQKANKKKKKKEEKRAKREERKEEPTNSSLEDMLAYVDEDGNIVDSPPDENSGEEVKEEGQD